MEERFVNTLISRNGEPDYVPLTTNLGLKYKRRMLYFPMDFGELTLDGLVDTGALSSAIPEADLRKIRLLAPQSIIKEGPAPNFQIMVANGQLETPKSTVELKFEVGDIDFHEIFIVMEKLTSPLIGLSFLQRNNTILDMRQGVLNFPFFSMQLKTADHKYTNVMEPICAREDITIPPNDRHMVSMFSQLYDDTNVTGIIQPSNDLAEDGDITFCAALVTLTQGQVSIHVNNFTDQPYTLKRGAHIANFSVLTPEQMKYVKPIDPVTTWHLLKDNPENAAYYASSLIKSPKTSDDSENYWFPTPEEPGDPQTHTPIQQRILRELRNLQDLEKLNPQDYPKSQLINNLRATFQCIRTAGLKLTMHKCHFGAKEIDFLGRTITPEGVRPQRPRVQNFLEKTKFPKSKKALQRYLGFLNYYRNYIPRLSKKLTPFFKLLKSDAKVMVTPDLLEKFTEINKALDRCCELALKQPLPDKQIALMTDASFSAAGYAVLIEDDPMEKYTSTRKAFAPVAYGSKTFSPAQLKMSIYAKEFLAIFFAFKEFCHIFWGTPKPVIILTDNKSVTRFFQTKIIPPTLWNACDYVMQFNFTIAHIPGKNNTAADYLSRLEICPKEKLILRIREDISTTPIELNVQSAGVTEEEQIFYTDDDEETEEQIWKRKQDARSNPMNQPPDVLLDHLSTHDNTQFQTQNIQKLAKPTTMAIEQ